MYCNGLNNIDLVYYINLDHRTDRHHSITNELNKTNIDKEKINRIPGIYIKNFGNLGCGKSHILALETFLKSSEKNNYCLILEDDFQFTKEQEEVNDLINKAFTRTNFDILLLSANILNGQSCEHDFLTKIYDSQTMSGYIVNRKFAPILLHNFKEAVSLLEENHRHYLHRRYLHRRYLHFYCIDMYMKKLQPLYKWYALNPKVGKQMVSFSDIEKKIVSYGC
jgi:GR25 family glycosyltransferase involved in LPS biosynthesis